MFNDSVPCGVDASTLTLNLSLIELLDEDVMLSNMDGLAEQVGMQLGSYYCAYLVILAHPSNLLIFSLFSQTNLLLTQPL